MSARRPVSWVVATVVATGIVVAGASSARARVITYVAKAGDTAESIASDYYGNRSLALLITEGNALPRDAKIKPGQKIRIPTAVTYKVRRGDTLEGLAMRFLDDRRRAPALAQLCGLRSVDKLREGQELTIPFQHLHQAEAPESLTSVARAFYGDGSRAKLLQEFNFRSSPMLGKGEKIIVPIAHVHIRSVRLQQAPPPPAPSKKGAPPPPPQQQPLVVPLPAVEAQRREAELAERVALHLRLAEKAYKEGEYAEVPAQLDKLLAAEDPSEPQLAEIFRLKAYSYVALGLDELAVSSFREVLARKPDLVLDEATVSPKIRAALERARRSAPP
jgi:LysM repeat protein